MSCYRRAGTASETWIDGELFLVLANQEIVHLDRLAAALWRLLDRPLGFEALLEVFAQAFPATPAVQLRGDLVASLAQLEAAGALARVG